MYNVHSSSYFYNNYHHLNMLLLLHLWLQVWVCPLFLFPSACPSAPVAHTRQPLGEKTAAETVEGKPPEMAME